MSDWQPIATVPQDGRLLRLAKAGRRGAGIVGYFAQSKWWQLEANGKRRSLKWAPTHWKPLPSAQPKEAQP